MDRGLKMLRKHESAKGKNLRLIPGKTHPIGDQIARTGTRKELEDKKKMELENLLKI